jgi:hypothetical protein
VVAFRSASWGSSVGLAGSIELPLICMIPCICRVKYCRNTVCNEFYIFWTCVLAFLLYLQPLLWCKLFHWMDVIEKSFNN